MTETKIDSRVDIQMRIVMEEACQVGQWDRGDQAAVQAVIQAIDIQ